MHKNIVLPVDLRHEHSLQQVVPAALVYSQTDGAHLHLVTVVPELALASPTLTLPRDFKRRALEEARKRLSDLAEQYLPEQVNLVQTVREGSIYREILAVAAQVNADLIIMASRKPSMQTYLLGSNAARVVEHAKCSVLVVRPN